MHDAAPNPRLLARPRVMVVEDDPLVRRSLVRTFGEQAELVCFGSIGEATPRVHEAWDGIVIDRGLPDGDGLLLAQHIVQRDPRASVVLFTASEPHEVIEATNRHGIVYAHKVDGIAVLSRMMTLWTRRFPVPSTSRDERLLQLRQATPLTHREEDVVRAALEGLTGAEVSKRLAISERTYGAHVSNLLAKTGFKRMTALIASLSGENPRRGREDH